jgi:prepilin-type N-terminal cleavage/methylation domain-containing protein
MFNKHHKRRGGFTLVEIMIVVAIIALLAAIALPNFLRARKRSQATRILEDLRVLDHAMDQYAIDTGKPAGYQPVFGDLQNYLKTDTMLYSSGGTDMFGDSYGPFTVDSSLNVPANAFDTLSDVADASFWGPYYTADSGSGSGSTGSPFSSGNPMGATDYENSMGPILALDTVLGQGGTPTQAQITAAQQANLFMQQTQAAGGMSAQQTQAYQNAITNNFNNNTVHIATYLNPG